MAPPSWVQNPKQCRKLPIPQSIGSAIGKAIGGAALAVTSLPALSTGALSLARAHLVPASITVFAAWKVLQAVRSRRTPASAAEDEASALPEAFKDLTADAAEEELQQLQVVMLEQLVGQLVRSMLEDTLAVTLSAPFSGKPEDAVREQMVAQLETLRELYGERVVELLQAKLEKQHKWTKLLTEQAQLLDAGNPRLNFTQPKRLEDPKEWVTATKLGN